MTELTERKIFLPPPLSIHLRNGCCISIINPPPVVTSFVIARFYVMQKFLRSVPLPPRRFNKPLTRPKISLASRSREEGTIVERIE